MVSITEIYVRITITTDINSPVREVRLCQVGYSETEKTSVLAKLWVSTSLRRVVSRESEVRVLF